MIRKKLGQEVSDLLLNSGFEHLPEIKKSWRLLKLKPNEMAHNDQKSEEGTKRQRLE